MDRGSVTIVGAGPGDPELITLKGLRKLEEADAVLYPGSLIPREFAAMAKGAKELIDTAPMTLEQILSAIEARYFSGKRLVRLVSGDPALFSALHELSQGLENLGIPFEVVPGVSSVLAAAAKLKAELTVPEVCQSVVITRLEGRTPVPEGQEIEAFAKTGSSVVLFLSAGLVGGVSERLVAAFGASTPAVVAFRVGYKDERLLRTSVGGLKDALLEEGIARQALIFIGKALLPDEDSLKRRSRLYHPAFGHGFRGPKRS